MNFNASPFNTFNCTLTYYTISWSNFNTFSCKLHVNSNTRDLSFPHPHTHHSALHPSFRPSPIIQPFTHHSALHPSFSPSPIIQPFTHHSALHPSFSPYTHHSALAYCDPYNNNHHSALHPYNNMQGIQLAFSPAHYAGNSIVSNYTQFFITQLH